MTIRRSCCRCAQPATRGRFCATHVPKRNRPSSAKRGYDGRWRRFRAEYLRTRPYCEAPWGCGKPAVDVHHLDGEGPNGPRGFDPSNLQPLCHECHAEITAREQAQGHYG